MKSTTTPDRDVCSSDSSAPLTWECTNPSPDFVWWLGNRKEKPARVENVVAIVERTAGGKWRWIAYVGGGSKWGFEPSCDTAMRAAELSLPACVLANYRPA